MMEDLKNIPLEQLTDMVSGFTIGDATGESVNKEEVVQETTETVTEEVKETQPQEQEEKKSTPDSIKKLLHQRSELRKDNDRLKAELEESKNQLRKLRSGELDESFRGGDGEINQSLKDEAIQDAKMQSQMIERDYNKSNNMITNSREVELAEFFIKNPDLGDVRDDIVEYANMHKDLDISDISNLILSKVDPTRLLDEQTKNKLKGGYGIPGTDYVPEVKEKQVKDMSTSELLNKIEELGLL